MLCDEPCTDCEDTGVTIQTERYCSCHAGIVLRAASDPDRLREDRDERRALAREYPDD